jgi:uracil-DNA glycosylase
MGSIKTPQIRLEPSWKIKLLDEFDKPYMHALRDFLRTEKQQKKIIYPKSEDIFKAFDLTPFHQTKVVIMGQDPYHGPSQAHGLSFSVPMGIAPPPSLQNIFKAIKQDLNINPPRHGCLESWGRQGVLLLNSVLTVEQGLAASHQSKGWEVFTDRVVSALNERKAPVVFVLWGSYAQNKGKFIDTNRHLVLRSAHPSPLSAYRGFLSCRHFSQINACLEKWGQKPIDWRLPEPEGFASPKKVAIRRIGLPA